MKYFFSFFLFLLSSSLLFSQQTVSGKITDSLGNPIIYSSVLEKNTTNGTISDFDGNYSIEVNMGAALIFSSTGYTTKEIIVGELTSIDIVLQEGSVNLKEVIIVGSRTPPRSNTDTPLPVDIISGKDIVNTGQITFDKALQYKIPSFNTVQTPVSDATSLLDPYEIRNLGPSRTLILINGKRKNLSALVYTYGIAGRGETGADISAIPLDAIKRVEVLRDGASAQYGSDAIAGVVNIVLKDNPIGGSATIKTGITSKGDGEQFGVSINNASNIGKDNGFVNYTVDLSKVNLANRPGLVNAAGEIADFTSGTAEDITFVNQFLERHPDAGNINGSPGTAVAKFLINGGVDLSEKTKLYFNTAYVYKSMNSYANYRTPYWRTLDEFPYLADFFPTEDVIDNYDGYVPTFDGILNDYHSTVGFKTQKNDWNYDVSFTIGGNLQKYTVRNSHNSNFVYSPSTWIDSNNDGSVDDGEITEGQNLYRGNSPISFDAGGARFNHTVGNIDISKTISDKISLALGAEFRNETFEIIAGELASYDGGGSDSFAGSRPENAKIFNRYNFGGYLDVAYDVTDKLLFNGTLRVENYSDFGNTLVWKLSSRYKVNNNLTLRSSLSTGFRAPTLHQIYSQKLQYSFVAGQGIQVTGLINNVSPQAKILKIPQLDSEKSTNFTLGLGAKIATNFKLTMDYYNISIKDRIVLSGDITGLNIDNLNSVSFFINALDTRTSGLDVVLNYKKIPLGNGNLGFNLSGNYTIDNKRTGKIKNPAVIENSGQSVFDTNQETGIFLSRPKTKWIFGTNYAINKFNISLNNTYFGTATFKDPGLSPDLRTEFIPKIVTDFSINYDLSKKIDVTLNVNNIFNVLPEWEFKAENMAGQDLINNTNTNAFGLTPIQEQSNLITFNQRYAQTTYFGYHFSQLGILFNLSFIYKI